MTDWPPVIAAPTLEIEKVGIVTLAVPAAAISMSLPPDTTYVIFEIVAYIIKDGADGDVRVRLNNDSGSNYTSESLANVNTGFTAIGVGGENTSNLWVSVTPLNANSAAALHMTLTKVTAAARAVGVGQVSFTDSSNNVLASGFLAWEWANTTDLISRIDIIALTNSMAGGTRIVLGGGRTA